jgi:DtxR family Mn-dependent transcriptional regulator
MALSALARLRPTALPVRSWFRLARVLDQSPEFLRYLTDCGLTLGPVGSVESISADAGLMRIRLGDRGLAIAIDAAGKLIVAEPERK